MKLKNHYNRGFTLIEMSIVLGIIGLLIGGVLSFYQPLDQNFRASKTKERMAKVANAMSSYALRNNRIPCPASPEPRIEPFGAEIGSGATGIDVGACTLAEAEGIVPYRTLGIRQEEVIDGYGNYLTYRVSPLFTVNDDTNDTVHDNCRTSQWVSGGVNINPDKARFCCPPIADVGGAFDPKLTDISVIDQSGLPVLPLRLNDSYQYGDLNTLEENPSGSPLAVAYVVLSHGPNQYGKYLIGSTKPTDRYTAIDLFGEPEVLNQDGDIEFIDTIEVSADTKAHYDDIILWRNQDSLLSELGTNSCARP